MKLKFLSREQRQKYLIWALIAMAVLGAVMVWYGYFKEETISLFQPPPPLPVQQISIDFRIFNNPVFEQLGSVPSEFPLPEDAERENPFFP